MDAGAEYLVTQMFFDNAAYTRFVDMCRKEGINVPIIPGLKPLTTLKQIAFIPKTFAIDLPDAFARELVACRSDADVKRAGIALAIHQAKELKAAGAPCLHFYTTGKGDAVKAILS